MAIAICDSVTVSIGEDISGAFKVIFLVKAEVKSYIRTKSFIVHFSVTEALKTMVILKTSLETNILVRKTDRNSVIGLFLNVCI